ncbi:MAG: hypothetical protein IPP71_06210 [Bacteroidetes bacterium]|nr:hypothetical protein [Bacteroidota bacterium]
MFPPKNNHQKFYFYWGWNRDWYTKSDIHFTSADFNFTLRDVEAHDKQRKFAIDPFLNPGAFTIPQTNFRVGYFLKNNWSISMGFDHMKYVVTQYQNVAISGTIKNTATDYNGVYNNEEIEINPNFLLMEHTDGLNYINIEMRHQNNLLNLRKYNMGKFDVNVIQGFGMGFLFPKSDVTILGNARNDEFHVSGYGISTVLGMNITFREHFFIQGEVKGGFINLPDIRITANKNDVAHQQFFFFQSNIVLGTYFRLWKVKPAPPLN